MDKLDIMSIFCTRNACRSIRCRAYLVYDNVNDLLYINTVDRKILEKDSI